MRGWAARTGKSCLLTTSPWIAQLNATPEQAASVLRPDIRAVGAMGILAYFILVGDLAWREIHPAVRILSALFAAGVVLSYFAKAPSRADHFDRMMVLALLLFGIVCAFSQFPRQSFDSILAATLGVSALFAARELLARDTARQIFIAGLMTLSAVLTIVTAAQLIPPFVEWWALTNWTVFPPLDLKVIPEPWIFRYEIALLLVLLYPSWWIGKVTTRRAVAATFIGILTLAICVIVGSRTIWLATAGGVAAVAIPVVGRTCRSDGRIRAVIAAIIGILGAALLLSELGATVAERLVRIAPLTERSSVWGSLFEAWAERPLTGQGPGSLPWLLQLTDYFETHSFAPRHADSAIVQLVVETGIVGIAAALIVLLTVLPAVFAGRSQAATFAFVTSALAQITLNPAEFSFITAVVIAWIAFGVPRSSHANPRAVPGGRQTRLRWVLLTLVAVVGVAFGATVVGAIAYSSARQGIARGDVSGAAASLELAAVLDPGMAIYPRQLGTLRLITGDVQAAIDRLERATRLNPSDDLAWRVLGLAQAEADDAASAIQSIRHAVDVQRSDATNLLLLAEALGARGDHAAAKAVLAEVVQAWPAVVANPEFRQFAAPASTIDLVRMARDRWKDGLPSPEPHDSQRILLGVMMGLAPSLVDDEPSSLSRALEAAYISVMRCDPDAGAALRNTRDADRRQPTYWALAVRLAVLEGGSPRDYQRLHRIMTGDWLLSSDDFVTLNPLDENGVRQSSADTWGYRRPPIDWPATQWNLPSPRSGVARLHLEPPAAAMVVGMGGLSGQCESLREESRPVGPA